ncbi:hypothetical protein ACPCAB_08190 [Streptomyces koyangensis]|uniref:hypothetical protein n=1 Tax=Streptomyces koyangensis TaxID=188770 RepID=UPI003C2EF75B
MGDFIEQAVSTVSGDAFAAFIGIITTAAVGGLRWQLHKRLPAKRMWRFSDARSLTLAIATSGEIDTGLYPRPTTGLGQVRAVALLAPSLTRAYRELDLEQLRLSATVRGDEFENDLVVLGGPKNNHVAEHILAHIPGIPLRVDQNLLFWEGEQYTGVVRDKKVLRDYGYVVRAPNPFASERRVVVIAGAHTYGTIAAARWMVESGGAREIPADVAVLVEAMVLDGGHVTRPKVIHRVAL